MVLGTSQIPDTMALVMARDRWQSKRKAREAFEELQAYYRGGDDVVQFLNKHPDETPEEFKDRQTRMASLNFLGRLADAVANSIYGGPLAIDLPNTTPEQMKALGEVYSYNGFDTVRTVLGNSLAVNGGAWCNVAWIEQDKQVGIHVVPPQAMDYEVHPDIPWRLAAIDECRKVIDPQGAEAEVHWIWSAPTADDPKGFGILLGANGECIDNRFVPNPYGVIPYVYSRGLPQAGLFEGLSYLRDTLTIQRAIFDDLSDLRSVVELQSFGVPWADASEPKSDDGSSGVPLSPRRILWLGKQGASLNFASPGAQIVAVLDYLERLVEWMFQTRTYPVEVIRGSVTESGVALRIKWGPWETMARAARLRAATAEAELARLICIVGRAHGRVDLPDPEKMLGDGRPVVRYLEDILPEDEAMERTQDQLDVDSGLMTKSDYLITWREGVDSEEKAEEYIAKINEERGSVTQPEPPAGDSILGGFGL